MQLHILNSYYTFFLTHHADVIGLNVCYGFNEKKKAFFPDSPSKCSIQSIKFIGAVKSMPQKSRLTFALFKHL